MCNSFPKLTKQALRTWLARVSRDFCCHKSFKAYPFGQTCNCFSNVTIRFLGVISFDR